MLTMFLAMLETEADRQKFTQLYEAMEKKIYAVALRILGSPEQAEDAAQQAWLRLIQKWELVSALSWEKAGGYAVTAAKNAALDLTRLQSRTVPLPEDWDPPAQETGGDGYQYLVSLVREGDWLTMYLTGDPEGARWDACPYLARLRDKEAN